jgi:hypothetical protein
MFRLVRREIEDAVDHSNWKGDLAHQKALDDVLRVVSASSNYKAFITQQATYVQVCPQAARTANASMLRTAGLDHAL